MFSLTGEKYVVFFNVNRAGKEWGAGGDGPQHVP